MYRDKFLRDVHPIGACKLALLQAKHALIILEQFANLHHVLEGVLRRNDVIYVAKVWGEVLRT